MKRHLTNCSGTYIKNTKSRRCYGRSRFLKKKITQLNSLKRSTQKYTNPTYDGDSGVYTPTSHSDFLWKRQTTLKHRKQPDTGECSKFHRDFLDSPNRVARNSAHFLERLNANCDKICAIAHQIPFLKPFLPCNTTELHARAYYRYRRIIVLMIC